MLRTIQNSIATVFAELTTKAVARSPRRLKPRGYTSSPSPATLNDPPGH
jgi:hypothetical protein